MKHLKPVLLAALILSAGWGVRLWRQERSGSALSYTLTPVAEGVRVALSVRAPSGELALRPLAYDLLLPMEGLEAFSEDGSPLPIERRPGELKMGKDWETSITRYVLKAPGRTCRVRYLAKPPVFKLGGTCAPIKQYSLAGESLSAVPGSCLFLVPDGPVRALEVLGPGDLERLNGLPIQEALDRLPEAMLLGGSPETRQAGSLRVLLSPAFSPEDRRLAMDWTERLTHALEAQLGAAPALTLALVPPQGPNLLAVSDRSPRVQVSELNPRSGTGKQDLAEGLALRWLGESPEAALESTQPGAWLRVGWARLAAHRALQGIGEKWAGEEALAASFEARLDVPLERPPGREDEIFHSYVHSRKVKAPCAAMLLDWEIARLTGGRKSLRDLWTLACLDGDVEKAAADLAGPGIRTLFERWIRGSNRLLHPFPFLARPNPFAPVPALQGPPRLRLLLTGHTQAYLETCGCKLSQSGGIARRQTAFREARRDGAPSLTLDLGGFFPYATKPGELDALSEMEIRFYLDAMGRMGYAAASLGIQETLHGRTFLERMLQGTQAPRCLSADLDLEPAVAPWINVETGPWKIGLVGATGDPAHWEGAIRFDAGLSGVRPRSPGALAQAVKACRASGAQRVLLLGAVSAGLLDQLLEAGAAPDLALDAEPHPLWRDVRGQEPPVWMGLYKGVAWAREPKGSYGLSVLDLAWGEGGGGLSAALRTVELNESVPADPDLRKRLDDFYAGLVQKPEAWASFDPLFAWDPRAAGRFAGVETCRGCHPGAYEQWKGTKHADAMRILVQQHRNFNPKCVVCHVTGMGREGGHVLSAAGHPMENVQCEVCHGAGAEHAQSPSSANIRRTPAKAVCLECHNSEHSEQFEKRFHEAWEKVRH